MPTIKKHAYEAVIRKLEDELASINYKIRRNKVDFKTLVNTQTTLKRERGILRDLLRQVRGSVKREDSSLFESKQIGK